MRYIVTLNGKEYAVEVANGQAQIVDAAKPAAPAAAPAPAPAPKAAPAPVVASSSEADESEVVAVATAAIAASRGESNCAFKVVSIQKIEK